MATVPLTEEEPQPQQEWRSWAKITWAESLNRLVRRRRGHLLYSSGLTGMGEELGQDASEGPNPGLEPGANGFWP